MLCADIIGFIWFASPSPSAVVILLQARGCSSVPPHPSPQRANPFLPHSNPFWFQRQQRRRQPLSLPSPFSHRNMTVSVMELEEQWIGHRQQTLCPFSQVNEGSKRPWERGGAGRARGIRTTLPCTGMRRMSKDEVLVLVCELFDEMCVCVIALNYQVDVNDDLRHILLTGFAVFLTPKF